MSRDTTTQLNQLVSGAHVPNSELASYGDLPTADAEAIARRIRARVSSGEAPPPRRRARDIERTAQVR